MSRKPEGHSSPRLVAAVLSLSFAAAHGLASCQHKPPPRTYESVAQGGAGGVAGGDRAGQAAGGDMPAAGREGASGSPGGQVGGEGGHAGKSSPSIGGSSEEGGAAGDSGTDSEAGSGAAAGAGSGGSPGMGGTAGAGGAAGVSGAGAGGANTTSGTSISGLISGETWTSKGSPYVLTGDISVEALTIQRGVTVLADGPYAIEVSGTLTVTGTRDEPVSFSATPENETGWRGILFNAAQFSTLRHFSVEDSSQSGIRVVETSVILQNCLIRKNTALQGGGVFASGAAAGVTLQNCRLEDNVASDAFEAGGAVFVRAGGQVAIENSILAGNRTVYANARGGGIFVCGGMVTVLNTVLVDNGRSMYGNGSSGIAVNTGGLGGCADASAEVQNSILFDNVPSAILGSPVTVSYSNVQGGFAGTGNISANPVFLTDGSFALFDSSPCIDTGDPASAVSDRCLPPSRGQARNDMGAYGGPGACEW